MRRVTFGLEPGNEETFMRDMYEHGVQLSESDDHPTSHQWYVDLGVPSECMCNYGPDRYPDCPDSTVTITISREAAKDLSERAGQWAVVSKPFADACRTALKETA